MPSSRPYKLTIDAAANLLRIRLSGNVDAASMQACVDEVEKGISALKPSFRILTDLSGIQSMDTACIPKVKQLMDLCRSRGVQTVIRVIPNRSKDVGFSILSLFHYPPQKVNILTFATPAEAEKALTS
jgi:anti-anti-sigma regulatory factor